MTYNYNKHSLSKKSLIEKSSCKMKIYLQEDSIDPVHEALKPELREMRDSDLNVKISSHAKFLLLHIVSKDIPILRATMNSYLRMIATAEKTLRDLK